MMTKRVIARLAQINVMAVVMGVRVTVLVLVNGVAVKLITPASFFLQESITSYLRYNGKNKR